MRDITSGLDLLQAFPPKAAVTDGTAQVSAILDRQGYDSVMLALTTGTLTDTDAVWSVLIEDSDDGSTFAAVDDAYLNGTELLAGFAFGDDNECRKIGYTGGKRYVRATIDDTTANTGNLFVAGIWVCGHPSREPTANPPAMVPFT
jgi:hypothetical protein